ncbi:glutathione S-transferase omega-1-like [Dendronephthya gigantea]|uniref:glutathione S-transferase omega-1-like n=1 Tax=Dendronephthya gigantea TaxID=151771 RepID=UPI0010693E89|nr:glutathione S-transferase omega-1-like [Dendronephthya gigantea]
MSSKHLQTGDSKPAFDSSKRFRIYSMRFCPFAQRPILVAAAKGLNFDIVNIKLRKDLPEWYPSINPLCKVPAIEFPDGEPIYESLIVSDLLDDLYPEKQLHPKDPKEKAKQKIFIQSFGETLIPSFYKGRQEQEKTGKTSEEMVKNIANVEEYLAKQKSNFFGGDEAGMLDFMVWPWFERLPLFYTLSVDTHPNLTNWVNLMQNEPAVKETALSTENHLKFYEGYKNGQPDYDFL